MKMYKLLLKVFFKEGFSFKRLLGRGNTSSKGKMILLSVAIIYGLGSFLFAFGLLFFSLGKAFDQMGMIEAVLLYIFMYATFLSIVFVLFRSNGYLFNYKDYQILEPLPIKSKIVTYAKATVMMVLIWASLLIFTAPMAFGYFYFAGFNIISFIVYLIGIIVLPLVPAIIFSFVSMLVARITSRFKRGNIITTAMTFVVLLGVMYLSFSLNSATGTNPLLNQQEFMDSISKYYPNMNWFMNGVNDHSIVDILLLIVVNSGLFFIFLTVIQKIVLKANQKGISHKTNKRIKPARSKQGSVYSSIISKELSKLLNTPAYAINSGFGFIIILLMGIAGLIFSNKIQDFLVQLAGFPLKPELLVLGIMVFALSTIFTSAITLSLEGKNFWILKSLPIKPKKIMFSKMFFNVLLGLPVAIVSIIMLSFVFKTSILPLLVMIVFIASFSFAASALGSIINLTWPKFEFVDPIEVVKQSIGAILGMFGGLAIALLDGLIVYFLFNTVSWEISILLASLLNYLIFAGLAYYISVKSESLFIKMNA